MAGECDAAEAARRGDPRHPLPGVRRAFGEADHIISLDDVRRFRDALETHRKSYDIHVYKGAPHGWP